MSILYGSCSFNCTGFEESGEFVLCGTLLFNHSMKPSRVQIIRWVFAIGAGVLAV